MTILTQIPYPGRKVFVDNLRLLEAQAAKQPNPRLAELLRQARAEAERQLAVVARRPAQ